MMLTYVASATQKVSLGQFSVVTALPRNMELGQNPRFKFTFLECADFSSL